MKICFIERDRQSKSKLCGIVELVCSEDSGFDSEICIFPRESAIFVNIVESEDIFELKLSDFACGAHINVETIIADILDSGSQKILIDCAVDFETFLEFIRSGLRKIRFVNSHLSIFLVCEDLFVMEGVNTALDALRQRVILKVNQIEDIFLDIFGRGLSFRYLPEAFVYKKSTIAISTLVCRLIYWRDLRRLSSVVIENKPHI